jgi:hypothetical protein
MNTERRARVIWYGDDPELADPGFQIYRLDDNAYLQELDKSFWVRGESRADMLVKTDRPMRRLQFRMLAGAVPTVVRIRLGDAQYEQALPAHGRAALVVDLPPGFPYKHDRPPESPVAYIWDVSISSSGGFTPVLVDDQSGDTRYLGVRIKPVLVE